MAGLTFTGLRNVGKQKGLATMQWYAVGGPGDGTEKTLLLPNGDGLSFTGWKYTIDPTSQQTSFTFGDAKSMLISLYRVPAFYKDDTHFNFPGRLWVYVQSSAQIYCFTPKFIYSQANGSATVGVGYPYESENAQIEIDGIQPGKIDLYFETQREAGSGVLGGFQPTRLNVTLANFELKTVGAI